MGVCCYVEYAWRGHFGLLVDTYVYVEAERDGCMMLDSKMEERKHV